jgi:hypothetical protein
MVKLIAEKKIFEIRGIEHNDELGNNKEAKELINKMKLENYNVLWNKNCDEKGWFYLIRCIKELQ